MPRVIGRKGAGIRLIKHILKIQFGIDNPNISVVEAYKRMSSDPSNLKTMDC